MKKRISFMLLCGLVAGAFAQTPGPAAKPVVKGVSRPKLVVGIVIDQMRYDYIYRYWEKYGNDGFKKLVNDGYFCKNANYNYVPTYTGPGHASIYTGTTPAVHGIVANDWFMRKKGRKIYCVQDMDVAGVGTVSMSGRNSPVNLLTTTITDELRLSSNMKSKVIGIALKDRSSILPAGHTGQAYWYDGSLGYFITSSFYRKDLPAWVQEFNKKELPKKYLGQPWTTVLPIDQYKESVADDNKYELVLRGETKPVFPHDIPNLYAANGGLGLIRSLPAGNTLTKDFAVDAIRGENLGKGEATDFLCISFSSPDYIGHAYGPNSVEQEDDYIRLDRDLAELFRVIEAQVGKGNALIFLTADHAAVEVPQYLIDNNIPAGYVKEWILVDSLKKYLKINYGDSLVSSFSNQQIYLNHKVIDEKKLFLQQVQEDVAQFMMRFPEVSEAITATTMNNSQFTEGVRYLMQKGYNAQRSGDVLVNYQPGYVEFYSPTGTTHGSPYSYDTHVPLLFYGWGIKPGSTTEQVYITDVAPTLAMLLNIQFPNGTTGKPIQSLTK